MAGPHAPERIETERLVLRRPTLGDAEGVFTRYASDPVATRYMSFPTHASVEAARSFLELCDAEWRRWPASAYLIVSRAEGTLLGSTGFGFETDFLATTGYILAADSWGRGFATEALRAIVAVSPSLGIKRLQAYCHPEHRASQHVLDKCGFALEGTLRRHTVFPNLGPEPRDARVYAAVFD
jgi:[ribosomal protein S5]-alanine N-acetyltransferase